MLSPKNAKRIILLLVAVEMFSVTYLLILPNLAWLASILNFLTGIGISFILMHCRDRDPSRPLLNPARSPFNGYIILLLGLIIFLVGRNIMVNMPMDYRNADMLPIIQVMNERFLGGHWGEVYNPIPEIWNGIKPIYLPAMWIPFSPAVLLKIDLRWISLSCLWISCIACVSWLRPGKKNLNDWFLLTLVFLFLGWLLFGDVRHGYISWSEEPIVAIYYILLAYALIKEKILMIGIATSLCVLSRFALIGWIPAFMIYLLLIRKNKQVLIYVGVGLICLVLFCILPFGWRVFGEFLDLPQEYIHFAGILWKDSPEVFTEGPGLAKFFGQTGANFLHLTLIIVSLIIPSLFVIFSYFRKLRNNFSNVSLATLKLSVVVFFNFIDVPYLYLFYTSCFISLYLAGYFLRAGEFGAMKAQA